MRRLQIADPDKIEKPVPGGAGFFNDKIFMYYLCVKDFRMRKITELINDFSINSIREIFIDSPKELEKFGYLISPKSKFESIQIFEKNYSQKFIGNLQKNFILSIKRDFFVRAYLTENSQKTELFKEKIVYEGRYHLRNVGNGEVEPLPTTYNPEMENVAWNLCSPEASRVITNSNLSDFHNEAF